MKAAALVGAMPGLSADRAAQLIAGANAAMTEAAITNVNRASMWLAQLGEESVSLRYTEEIASGAAYEGRSDLGNTQPGDGVRFKGRSFIQITGRHNYGALSTWAHGKGLVPTATYFVDNPTALASDAYVWLGAVWYWTVARPQLNKLADARDINGATQAINGGLNGLADRTSRWQHCLTLGTAILPDAAHRPAPGHGSTVTTIDQGDNDVTKIFKVSKANCRKMKKTWPGIFLGNGFTYTHIATVAELNTLRRRFGFPTVTISYNEHIALGGK